VTPVRASLTSSLPEAAAARDTTLIAEANSCQAIQIVTLTGYIWAEAWQFPRSLGCRAQHVTIGPEHSFIADGEAEERDLTCRRAGPAVKTLAKENLCTPAQPGCSRACSASAALLIKEFGSGDCCTNSTTG
jgi:hypothetical protein